MNIRLENCVPVMRLLGSNTSIFSSKSTAKGDLLGNFIENCCFGNCGSCLTYLRALLLRRNPRLESSGEPTSFSSNNKKKRKNTNQKINFSSVLILWLAQKQCSFPTLNIILLYLLFILIFLSNPHSSCFAESPFIITCFGCLEDSYKQVSCFSL